MNFLNATSSSYAGSTFTGMAADSQRVSKKQHSKHKKQHSKIHSKEVIIAPEKTPSVSHSSVASHKASDSPGLLKTAFIAALLLLAPAAAAAKPLSSVRADRPSEPFCRIPGETNPFNPICPADYDFSSDAPEPCAILSMCDPQICKASEAPSSFDVCPEPTVDILTPAHCDHVPVAGPDDPPTLLNGSSFTDCRSWARTLLDRTKSIGHEFLFKGQRAVNSMLGYTNDYVTPSGQGNNWKPDNEGLYVLIHGLNGHPSIWDGHASAIKDLHPQAEVRQPYVPLKGQTSLESAARPISDMVRDYIQHNPGRPVTLMGVSNGGRIASYIENDLRDIPSAIRVSNIAGVQFGSGIMNTLNDWGLSRFLMSKPIQEQLPYGSQTAQDLLEAERRPLPPKVERDFDFYATTEDTRLWPYSVALPQLGHGERHYIVHGAEHDSIVPRVRDAQLDNVIPWMQSHLQKREK